MSTCEKISKIDKKRSKLLKVYNICTKMIANVLDLLHKCLKVKVQKCWGIKHIYVPTFYVDSTISSILQA